jgi:CheY-like chemotaxis protein
LIRVLIADDDPDITSSTALLLKLAGFDVQAVTKASEILPALERRPPQVLLQDVRMPELQLEELVTKIRTSPRLVGVKLVLFTATAPEAAQLAAIRPDAIVEKPYQPKDLPRIIERMAGAG